MNYTKGPWFVKYYGGENTGIVESLGSVVCDTGSTKWKINALLDNKAINEKVKQCEANASLISAAPEMYEALKGFLALCPSSEGLGGHAPIEAFFVIADKARKAILKAEGRSEE